MGYYEEQILPRGINWVMSGKIFRRLRAQYLQQVSGDILEVGFGSGLNLPYYSSRVDRVYALDPSRVAHRLAAQRISVAPFPVETVDLREGIIDLPDHSVDQVVTTWTLCTIPDALSALKEMQRVLKPHGRYHFLEHGRSPEKRVSQWQDIWNPLQKRFAGGCHVNRPIRQLIIESGFRIESLNNFYMAGPKIFTYMYQGSAVLDRG
ncbi:MAG: class I SAM-dependent methyltransferase [Nitrospina sp.]|nr:MAG: class I SAM-dependent methyltransferase [Nitrospina sp.]